MLAACAQREDPIGAAGLLMPLALACVMAASLLACGSALAWLTAQEALTNEVSISPPQSMKEAPFVALYVDPETSEATLLFDRAETIPTVLGERRLQASWRGMETGEAEFSQAGVRPWESSARAITTIISGQAAKDAPIRVLDMREWFRDMPALRSADVSGITPDAHADGARTPSTDLSRLFFCCTALTTIEGLEAWDVSGQTMATDIFYGCQALEEADISTWDMRSITVASGIFSGCSALSFVDLGMKDMPACTRIDYLFMGCASLREISGIEHLHCPQAQYAYSMFKGCEHLEVIDLSGFGMAAIWGGDRMFEGCASLRYLDISSMNLRMRGAAAQGFYPTSSNLETFIASNRISTGTAPAPRADADETLCTFSPGYWIFDDTGDAYGQAALARYLDESNSDPVYARLAFHRSSSTVSEEDAFAAVYDRQDGTYILVMDKGAEAPATFEGSPLAETIRDYLIEGEAASARWRCYAIAEVRIGCHLAPLSCRSWFEATRHLGRIANLDLLDMSRCTDVWHMFYRSTVASLALDSWKLPAKVAGIEEMFTFCSCLEALDMGSWDQEAALTLHGMDSLQRITVPSTMRILALSDTTQAASTRFFDGYWYEGGLGVPLTSWQVISRVNGACGTGDTPLTFAHEKMDRSYAALYADATDLTLVFGRGLDVPAAFAGAELMESFRGLEEQDMPNLSWCDFTGDVCPWSAEAKRICAVMSDETAKGCPIKPTIMDRWFQNMSLVQHISALETGAVDPTRVRSSSWLFYGCTALTSVPSSFMSRFTSVLTEAMAMFAGCSSLARLEAMSGSAMAHVQDTHRMFEGCSSLAQLDLSGWDISSLRSCSGMFNGCHRLRSVALPAAFAHPLRPDALQLAFNGCFALERIDAESWDLSASYTLLNTFNGCHDLTEVKGAEHWDTSKVTTMSATFRQCESLILDCTAWDVSSVADHDDFSLDAPYVLSPFASVAASSASEENIMDADEHDGADAIPHPAPPRVAEEGKGPFADANDEGSQDVDEPLSDDMHGDASEEVQGGIPDASGSPSTDEMDETPNEDIPTADETEALPLAA